MRIPESVVQQFEQLRIAFERGRVALAPTKNKETGEVAYMLIVVTPMHQGDENTAPRVLMAPWGILFHKDEREHYARPGKGDPMIMPGYEFKVRDEEGLAGGQDPDTN